MVDFKQYPTGTKQQIAWIFQFKTVKIKRESSKSDVGSKHISRM